jgi:hypothetical protein
VASGALFSLVELLRDGADDGRAIAVAALHYSAAGNDATTAAIVAAGALPPLKELSRSGSVEDRADAAAALYTLKSCNDANKAAIVPTTRRPTAEHAAPYCSSSSNEPAHRRRSMPQRTREE